VTRRLGHDPERPALWRPPRCSLGDPELGVAARISRPGLNFLFKSKPDLFAAAVRRALEQDLRTAACSLGDEVRPLQERLLEAFDTWTGRYLGAVGGELSAVAEAHSDVLGTAVVDAPRRFHALVTDAVVSTRAPQDRATSEAIARTLISTAIGLKHQTTSRETSRKNLGTAIALLLR